MNMKPRRSFPTDDKNPSTPKIDDPAEDPTRPPVTGSFVKLHSGEYFDYSNPRINTPTILDIAVGLSNTCRFAGQISRFYSVAEHCVHCVTIGEALGRNRAELRAVLMHDAAEAVAGDVPKPLKMLLPDYQAIEIQIQAAIEDALKIGSFEIVKDVDLMMLRVEKDFLKGGQDRWHILDGVADQAELVEIQCWQPQEACANFLDVAVKLDLISDEEVRQHLAGVCHVETLATLVNIAGGIVEADEAGKQRFARDMNEIVLEYADAFGEKEAATLWRRALVDAGYVKNTYGIATGLLTVYQRDGVEFRFEEQPNPAELN